MNDVGNDWRQLPETEEILSFVQSFRAQQGIVIGSRQAGGDEWGEITQFLLGTLPRTADLTGEWARLRDPNFRFQIVRRVRMERMSSRSRAS